MANISDANGLFTLWGKWPEEMIKEIEALFQEASSWWYSTELSEFTVNGGDCLFFEEDGGCYSAYFYGSGRWAYNNNLKYFGEMFKESGKQDIKDIYASLCKGMKESGAYIAVAYTDKEGACQLLYSAEGELRSNGEDLVYTETLHQDFEYTEENILSLGYEPDEYDDEILEETD